MTRKEVVEELAQRLDKQNIVLAKKKISVILDTIGAMNAELAIEAKSFPVPGVGLIKPITRAARVCHNPQTGGVVSIGERRTLKLSVSKGMFEQLNA